MAKSQSVNINFSQGLDTKTDPWQLPIGKFSNLQNSVFQKGGLLQKRNGYGQLTNVNPNNSYITTLNGNLTAVGSTVSAYSQSLETWITKGQLQPCSLNVLPLIRNNIAQTQVDTVISNGMVFMTYTEVNSTTNALVTQYLFAIVDAVTGQNIVPPTAIPVLSSGAISGSSRVFVVGNQFVIVSPVNVSSVNYLQYCSIPISNPVNILTNAANVSLAQNVSVINYVPITSNPGWDAVAMNSGNSGTLVVAQNSTTSAQSVKVTTLTSQQISTNSASSIVHSFANAAYVGALVSVCMDATSNPNVFYVSFWNNGTSNVYTLAVIIGLGTITQSFAPTIVLNASLANLASVAQNNSCLVLNEIVNPYSYDSTVPSNYIEAVTISSAASVGTPYVMVRSVGLGSKAFIVDGVEYFMGAFQSPFQPSYFLINATESTSSAPVVTAKLAYQNGGGYLSLGLPSVNVSDSVAQISYLYKDLVEALNTLSNPQLTTAGGIYSQTGINLVSFDLDTTAIATSEIAGNLHISGGYLAQYDGYLPVEHNFFLFPDSVEAVYTENSVVTPTGTGTNGSYTMVVSSATGIYVGMTVADVTNPINLTNGTTVAYVNGTTITLSLPIVVNTSGDTLSFQGNMADIPVGGTQSAANYYYQAVYEWTDNQGLAYRSQPSIAVSVSPSGTTSKGIATISVPTLRLTAKTANPVKIVIYRWSVNTQVYNQVTSISAPILNDPTVDSITFVDTQPDANIVGNNILYTTGGVVPDVNAPSSTIMTLFDTRLWLVNAEDPNSLWVSKQVVENTPVEMSSLFTIYVAPNIGTTGSTGPITALAPMDDKLIIFKKNAIYYINGVGPDNLGTTSPGSSLGNYSQPIFITSVVGCTNLASIVLTQDGLMFQSDKGIWLLGRNLHTSYIGSPVEDYNSFTVNSANVIPDTNYVLFTLNNNQMLMYDYYYAQWGTFQGLSAVSSCIYQDLHTLIDVNGRILQETPGAYLDIVDPVLMSFTTGWLNLATLQGYERFYDFYILAKYLSPHSLLCQVAYDYNPSILNQTLITPGNYSSPTPGPFGIPTPFGAQSNKEQWRIHAKQQLCSAFQLSITEVFNPAYATVAGAGFTMSGLNCEVGIKKATRPIRGSNAAGMS